MEQFDPDKTMPSMHAPGPDETQEFKAPEEELVEVPELSTEPTVEGRLFVQVPTPEEPAPPGEDIPEMLERSTRDDKRFVADVQSALQQHWPGKQVRILDYRWIQGTDPKRFIFKITVGNEALEVEVERENADAVEQAA